MTDPRTLAEEAKRCTCHLWKQGAGCEIHGPIPDYTVLRLVEENERLREMLHVWVTPAELAEALTETPERER